MKALIIEDEQMAQAQLRRLLAEEFSDIEIAGTVDSVAGAVELFRNGIAADMAFMDVELSDGTCFEIFRRIDVCIPVVMTTAYDSYALKAFETGSVDYLLKPIDPKALQRAVGRVRERLKEGGEEQTYSGLLSAIDTPKTYKEKSVVRLGDKIIPIRAEEIAYFFSEDKANYLMTFAAEKYIIDSSLDTLEAELDPKVFFRISRSCIIALKSIKSVSAVSSGRYLIEASPKAHFDLTVSRSRVEDFLAWLE